MGHLKKTYIEDIDIVNENEKRDLSIDDEDEFIDLVSKEKGWSLKDFYATDSKELNDLLGV